jgi:hypothetical protein
MKDAHRHAARGRWYDGGERLTRIPLAGADPQHQLARPGDAPAGHRRVKPFDLFRAAVEAGFFLLMLALMVAPLAFLCFVPTILQMRGRLPW